METFKFCFEKAVKERICTGEQILINTAILPSAETLGLIEPLLMMR